jgi:hypothetical protein
VVGTPICVSALFKEPVLGEVGTARIDWCSGRDLNPRRRLERPTCLTGLHYRSIAPPFTECFFKVLGVRRADFYQGGIMILRFQTEFLTYLGGVWNVIRVFRD